MTKLNKAFLLDTIKDAGYDYYAYVHKQNTPRCLAVQTVADLLSFVADLVEVAEDKYEISDVIRYIKQERQGSENVYFWPAVRWDDA